MESFSSTKLKVAGSSRNKLSRRQSAIISSRNKNGTKKKEPVLSIYAELSKRDQRAILNNELEICLPYGVKMQNAYGTRGLFFECVDEDTVKMLIEGLEASGLAWQEN